MSPQEQDKLKKFAMDRVMISAVMRVLKDSFMKRRDKDVYYLAAKSLALEFLEEAVKDFDRYLEIEKKSIANTKQIGL